jgi:hypothetical protein
VTLQERLTETHARAARLYLQRQQIEQQRQQLNVSAAQAEQAMLKTDGEIELLDRLIAEQKGGTDGV